LIDVKIFWNWIDAQK